MNSRVSTSAPFKRKCFISTVPFGNVKSPSPPTPIDVLFGMREPALLRRAVGPERGRGLVRNEAAAPAGSGSARSRSPSPTSSVGTGGAGGAAAAAVDDLVQAAARDVDDIELAVVTLAERSDRQRRVEQLLGGETAAAVRHETPDTAAAVVREQDSCPTRPGSAAAAVHVTARDREAKRAPVLVSGIDETRGRGTARRRARRTRSCPRGSPSRSCRRAARDRSPRTYLGRHRQPKDRRSPSRSSSATDCGGPTRRSRDNCSPRPCRMRPLTQTAAAQKDCPAESRRELRRSHRGATSSRAESVVSCAVCCGSPPLPPSPRPTIQESVGTERDVSAVVIVEPAG